MNITGRCERSFKTHICLRHSAKNLQKHRIFAHGVHNSRVFTGLNRNITSISKEFIETIIQDYDNKSLRRRKHLVAACMNDDVELYGLKAKSNKFLRRRIS